MGRPKVVIDLHDANCARDLAAGGMFVGSTALATASCTLTFNDEVDLVVRGGTGELTLHAKVVFVDLANGAGLELVGVSQAMKEQIAQLATAQQPMAPPPSDSTASVAPTASVASTGDAEPDTDTDDNTDTKVGETTNEDEPRKRLPLHERLRGLTIVQQLKMANSADPTERMTLERIYGKTVWEALLRNARLTAPEVARLARMGTMPRTLIELIVNNGSWLQIAEVRRALLTNPRLSVDQILRVLRLLPKHELKVAASLMTYPHGVRDAAKRLLKGADS